jgi:hypothetical protein
MPFGGGGTIFGGAGSLDGGSRRRGKRQRFVKAFVPTGAELFDLLGEGRSFKKRTRKTKRRRK